jgi:SAM-dependent methyltransferase
MNEQGKSEIHGEVASYYSEKLAQYGLDPKGVDWNGEESQILRFQQLAKIIKTDTLFSVNDLGCGYGALYDFLCRHHKSFDYIGIDVSEDMIKAASERYPGTENSRFIVAGEPVQAADYGIASGIFNVRQAQSDEAWRAYLDSTLDVLNRTSRLGFSFNCLTRYSDAGKMRDYLYYADPCELFDHCKRRYSHNVALLHDYELYEFTILVRKQP